MESQETCPYCRKELHGGIDGKNFIVCNICNVKVCINCSKFGYCLDHYNSLSDDKKKKLNSNQSYFAIFGIVLPALIPITIALIILLNPDFFNTISPIIFGICATILPVLLLIYVLRMLSLKNRKEHNIVERI